MSEARGRKGLIVALALAALALLVLSAGSRAEVTATHDTIIKFDSRIIPEVLPRHSEAPVGIEIEGHLKRRGKREPPPLTKLELAINRAASLSRKGLPVCDISRIDPASTVEALEACPGARIGHGEVRAQSKFPGQPRFFVTGEVVIFNGRLENGRPAILLHIFSARPPTSTVFPLTVSKRSGRFGTALTANVRLGRWSQITDFRLILNRTYRSGGKRRGFVNASCPAPKGLNLGLAPFVKATLSFADKTESEIAVLSSCKVGR